MCQFPSPAIPYTGHSDLYLATEQHLRSRFAVGGIDRGELAMQPGQLRFTGMRFEVTFSDVTGVRLVRRAFPWGTFLGLSVVAMGVAAVQTARSQTHGPGLLVLVGGLLAFLAWRQAREQWVEVTGDTGHGACRVCVRRERFGPGSGSRRNLLLLREIQAEVLGSHVDVPPDRTPPHN
jgi:hypothetical protein